MKRHPPELHAYILANYQSCTIDEMRQQVNELFGADLTKTAMKSYYTNHKLHVGVRKKIERKIWTPDMVDLLREYQYGRTHKEMAEILESKTGRRFTEKQVSAICKREHITNGIDGCFPKGHTPWTKGRKRSEFMSEEKQEKCRRTQFKKGDLPANYAEIGTIRKNHDGYLVRKVSDTGRQLDRWAFVHRLVWEEHFGPIPEGHLVGFKDGNKDNCSPDNLMLLTTAEHGTMNRYGYRSKDASLTETGLAITKVKIAMNQKRSRA